MKFLPSLLLLLLIPAGLRAQPVSLLYSFRSEGQGGLARISADAGTGEISAHERLFQEANAAAIRKVTVSPDRRFAAANLDGVEDRNNLLVFDLHSGGTPRYVSLPGAVDPILFVQNRLFAGTDKGVLFRMDPGSLAVEASWNFRELLTPGGRRPEDMVLDAEANILWVSFQKDSRNQRHRGSRIAGISLADDKVIADLQLPRDRPELHYALEVDGREAGPGPEVLHISPESNTLFVTLDLYGAVGMADLDAARRGELKNWTVLSTAADGSWGSAFPDRVGMLRVNGREILAVANASAAGGVAFVDPARRAIVQIADAPGGLSSLEALPAMNMLVSGSPGKIKARTDTGLGNDSTPLSSWSRFVYQEGEGFRHVSDGLGLPVHQACVLSPAHPWVLLNVGPEASEWRVIHPGDLRVLKSFPAFGGVQRLAR